MTKREYKSEDIKKKKQIALEYYRRVPIYKYAAMAAAVDEDTLLVWRKEDPVFSDKFLEAKSAHLDEHLKLVKRNKPEFPIERLYPEFKAKSDLGDALEKVIPILAGATLPKKEEPKP